MKNMRKINENKIFAFCMSFLLIIIGFIELFFPQKVYPYPIGILLCFIGGFLLKYSLEKGEKDE